MNKNNFSMSWKRVLRVQVTDEKVTAQGKSVRSKDWLRDTGTMATAHSEQGAKVGQNETSD